MTDGDHVFRMAPGDALFPDTLTALMAKDASRLQRSARPRGSAGGPVARTAAHPRDPPSPRRVPVHVVAARLGHADPAIALRVYAHVLQDQALEAAEVFAGLLSRGREVACWQMR